MTTKLTLSINDAIIKRAKKFAKNSNRSLSEIIETYLDKITNNNFSEMDEELNKIKGIITLPEDFDEKIEIRKILANKHL